MSNKSTRAKNRQRAQQRSQTARLRSVPPFPEARDEPADTAHLDGFPRPQVHGGDLAILTEGDPVYHQNEPCSVVPATAAAGRFHDARQDRDQIHQGITATLAATQRAIHRGAIERRALDVAGECMEDRDIPGALSVLASATRRLDRLDASAPQQVSA